MLNLEIFLSIINYVFKRGVACQFKISERKNKSVCNHKTKINASDSFLRKIRIRTRHTKQNKPNKAKQQTNKQTKRKKKNIKKAKANTEQQTNKQK